MKMNWYDYTIEGYEVFNSAKDSGKITEDMDCLEEQTAINETIKEMTSQAEHIFCEGEKKEYDASNVEYIDTVKGVDIYRCYGTDTYMFADSEE